MAFLAPIAAIGGTILSAVGSIASGNAQAAAQKTAAMQAEKAATERRAQASRDAAQKYKDAQLVLSNQQAAAAASGGGATDPTVLTLAGEVGGYGYQQRQGILANGENQARGYDDEAKARRAEAKSALRASRIGAFSSLLSGGVSAYKNYRDMMPS